MRVLETVACLKDEKTKIHWAIQSGLVNYVHQTCIKKIPNWTIENTADMINHQVIYTKQSLRLAAAMREYKNLMKIRRRKDALNIISTNTDKAVIALKIEQRINEDAERAKNRTRRKPATSEEKRGLFFALGLE